ncbi:hypothetical protein [Solicola sp. PLA-1-18]|uniref:hypothetical protein n=1 Tax=Solicola sp. PLA-1-18 TaxID=3380532 RepID=UPI003B7D5E7A
MHLDVDGEVFEVRERPGEPGTYDHDWVSGPHPGYGFASASSTGLTRAEIEDGARDFLSMVDPSTGFID